MSLPTEPTGPVTLRDLLLDNLIQGCSLDEVTDLCFRLGIDCENLPGATKAEKSRQLILFLERRKRIPELVLLGRRLRSDLKWELSVAAKPVVSPSDPASRDPLVLEKPFHLELVRVPAGEFWMGSDPTQDEDAQSDELPKHRVYVSEFYIGKYLVTNAQYAVFAKATYRIMLDQNMFTNRGRDREDDYLMGFDKTSWIRTGSVDRESRADHRALFDREHWTGFVDLTGRANHPVVKVSWYDAVEFCEWFSQNSEKKLKLRLPTEAEWEKAARGTDGRIYPWEKEWDAGKANTTERGPHDTTPVGQYSPAGDSPYGVADMAGNVWEWTSSLWGKLFSEDELLSGPQFKYPYDPSDGRENLGAGDDVMRVVRGGSWNNNQNNARAAYRSWSSPLTRDYYFGFRVVLGAAPVP